MSPRSRILDYPDTCPDIDKYISEARERIFEAFEEEIEAVCPRLPEEVLKQRARNCADALYQELEAIFEKTRETNASLRSAAEHQIEALQNERDEWKTEASQFESDADAYRTERDELQRELDAMGGDA